MNCTGKRCIVQFGKVDPSICECVSYCPQATPPKTNGDRIRSMSDEELAALFKDHFCPMLIGADMDCQNSCEKCWLDWLKQEASEKESAGA